MSLQRLPRNNPFSSYHHNNGTSSDLEGSFCTSLRLPHNHDEHHLIGRVLIRRIGLEKDDVCLH